MAWTCRDEGQFPTILLLHEETSAHTLLPGPGNSPVIHQPDDSFGWEQVMASSRRWHCTKNPKPTACSGLPVSVPHFPSHLNQASSLATLLCQSNRDADPDTQHSSTGTHPTKHSVSKGCWLQKMRQSVTREERQEFNGMNGELPKSTPEPQL